MPIPAQNNLRAHTFTAILVKKRLKNCKQYINFQFLLLTTCISVLKSKLDKEISYFPKSASIRHNPQIFFRIFLTLMCFTLPKIKKGTVKIMKSTGIVRKVDELGRVVLPISIRQTMDIGEKDSLEIFTDENRIILQKYQPSCVFCTNADNIVMFSGKRICEDCLKKIKEAF